MDPDKVSIIEYKTGGDREGEGEHLAQMRNYLRIAETYTRQADRRHYRLCGSKKVRRVTAKDRKGL